MSSAPTPAAWRLSTVGDALARSSTRDAAPSKRQFLSSLAPLDVGRSGLYLNRPLSRTSTMRYGRSFAALDNDAKPVSCSRRNSRYQSVTEGAKKKIVAAAAV